MFRGTFQLTFKCDSDDPYNLSTYWLEQRDLRKIDGKPRRWHFGWWTLGESKFALLGRGVKLISYQCHFLDDGIKQFYGFPPWVAIRLRSRWIEGNGRTGSESCRHFCTNREAHYHDRCCSLKASVWLIPSLFTSYLEDHYHSCWNVVNYKLDQVSWFS